MTTALAEIRALIAAHAADPEDRPGVDGVRLRTAVAPTPPLPVLFQPMLYLVFQGAKQLLLDDRTIGYRSGELVTMCIDLPALANVTEASAQQPYMAVELPLDRTMLAGLAAQMPSPARSEGGAITVRPLPDAVLDPMVRLLRMLDAPADARVLAEGVKREILYRMLSGPHSGELLQLARVDSVLARIGHLTEWMYANVGTPVDVAGLAGRAGMSVTTFHRHFKAATGTTPLDYHKRLRLHEARRLVAAGADSISRIAATVGYASPSHFSRDYKRAFGTAPIADALRVPAPDVRGDVRRGVRARAEGERSAS